MRIVALIAQMVSVVLLVASLVLWVRSYSVCDTVLVRPLNVTVIVWTRLGGLHVRVLPDSSARGGFVRRWLGESVWTWQVRRPVESDTPTDLDNARYLLGFRWSNQLVGVPFWFLTIVAAIMPSLRLWGRRRRRGFPVCHIGNGCDPGKRETDTQLRSRRCEEHES